MFLHLLVINFFKLLYTLNKLQNTLSKRVNAAD